MQAHGQTHNAQLLQPRLLQPPVGPLHTQYRIAGNHPDQTARTGQQLRQDRSQRRAEHVHTEGQNEHDVQRNVHQGRRNQPDHRRTAVAQSPEDACGEVVEEVGGQTGKDGDDVGVRPRVDIRRGVHARQDRAAEQNGCRRQRRADGRTKPDAVGHIPPQFLLLPRAEPLGYGYGKAAAHACAEAHHQEVDGAGRAYRSQRRAAQCLPHNGRIHHVVELLEQVSEQRRDTKTENQPHRTAPC